MQKEPENPVLALTGRKPWLGGAKLPLPHSDAWWWLSEKQPESDIKITAKSIKQSQKMEEVHSYKGRVGILSHQGRWPLLRHQREAPQSPC